LATTFAGILCRITREIHVRVIIVTIAMAVMAVMIATIVRVTVDDETGTMMDHGAV
jgi:hypothetical protein